MDGCPERALDTHIYQAWRDPDSRIGFYTDACNQKKYIANMEREFGPVVVGEWSLGEWHHLRNSCRFGCCSFYSRCTDLNRIQSH
jgi:hypothetical protein